MTTCSIDIRLKRASKEYAEGVYCLLSFCFVRIHLFVIQITILLFQKDIVSGEIIITGSNNQPIQHSGIFLFLDGMVNINLSSKNVGVFEAFYNSAKVSLE